MAEMALGVADGIRNPVTVIGGLIKRISKRIDVENSTKKDWDILLQEAERLERLVRDFEDLADRREILLEISDINQLIKHSVEDFKRNFLREKKSKFKLSLDKDPCATKIDKRLMGAAFTHLFFGYIRVSQSTVSP